MRRFMIVAVVGLTLATLAALATPAFARWDAHTGATSEATASAMTVPAGVVPAVSVDVGSVALTWTAITAPPVDGYVVHAYDQYTDTPRPLGGGCAGIVATTMCTDTDVPDGTWYYTVTPVLQSWHGSASAPSGDALVESHDPAPIATQLVNAHDGTAGVIDPGEDQVVITFSEPPAVASFCDDWAHDELDQALAGEDVEVRLADDGATTTMTVSASGLGRCALHLGTIAFGPGYLTSPSATFTNSKVEWKVGARRLIVTLGNLDAGSLASTPAAPATVTFTPDPSITDRFGHAVVVAPIATEDQRL